MKATIYFILFLLFSTSVFSQDSLTTLKPAAGDRVLSIGLINNSGFWSAKKYKTNQKAFRLGITGVLNTSPAHSNTTTNDKTQFTSTFTSGGTNFSIGIFAGMQKGFGNYKRVEPYAGIDLGLTYSYFRDFSKSWTNDTTNNYNGETKRETPFTMSFSILPLVGFNYYIAPRFAVGAEYRLSIASLTYIGESKTTRTPAIASTYYENYSTKNDPSFFFNANFTGTAYITATIFFK